MLNYKILTVLPQVVQPHFEHLPFKRALQRQLISIGIINLRDFALDFYGTIDDKPFGGGVGMVLMIEPIYKALLTIYPDMADTGLDQFISTFRAQHPGHKIVLLDPKGKKYTQATARNYTALNQIVFICGRYEGVDERVAEYLATDRISTGNYVLSGGELPALTIMESVARLLPGSLEKEEAVIKESFSESLGQVEHPQYTRPENFKGLKVPEILLSGHHKKIEEWKESFNDK